MYESKDSNNKNIKTIVNRFYPMKETENHEFTTTKK